LPRPEFQDDAHDGSSGEGEGRPRGLRGRLKGLFAPLLAGMLLDAVDFVTLGPIGMAVGFFAGFGVGWWLAPELGFRSGRRVLAGLLGGVYCTLPMTGFVPAATVAAGLVHFFEGSGAEEPRNDP
jgi:hypothetical protein